MHFMPPNNSDLLEVEVAYAAPDREIIIASRLAHGSTVRDAIDQSGVLRQAPEIDLAINKIGVYGKIVALDCVLHPHDRVEIYRPLRVDPKEIRRRRASKSPAKAN